MADDLDKPNGIAFSPDARMLYLADSGADHRPHSFDIARAHHVLAHDVVDGCRLADGRLPAAISPGLSTG